MASYTITTTDDQEAALKYAFDKATAGNPPLLNPLPPGTTQEQYFQMQINQSLLAQMMAAYNTALDTRLRASMNTIPPENQEVAQTEIAAVIVDQGGEVLPLIPGTPDTPPVVLRR